MFNISKRQDSESDDDMSVVKILEKARKNKEKRITASGPTSRRPVNQRGTVIAEVGSDEENDSFEIKREIKKKNEL